jgi:hypothetical protein
VRTTSSVRVENAINATTSKPVTLTLLDTDERTGEGFRPAIVTFHGLLGHIKRRYCDLPKRHNDLPVDTV